MWRYALASAGIAPERARTLLETYYRCDAAQVCADLPESEAEWLGDLFGNMDLSGLADLFWSNAVRLSADREGMAGSETLYYRTRWADNIQSMGDLGSAERAFADIAAALDASGDTAGLGALVALERADLRSALGDNVGAVDLLETGLAALSADLHSDESVLLEVRNSLCLELNYAGRFVDADRVCHALVEDTEQRFGTHSYEAVTSLNSLGFAQQVAGNVEGSLATLEEAQRRLDEMRRPNRSLWSSVLHNMATALVEQDQTQRAEVLLWESLVHDGSVENPAALTLAQIRRTAGDGEAAEQMLRARLHDLDALGSLGAQEALIARGFLGEALHAQGRLLESKREYERVRDGFTAIHDAAHPYTPITLQHLLRVSVALGEGEAVRARIAELDVGERQLLITNLIGSERMVSEYARSFQASTDLVVSAALDHFPEDPTMRSEAVAVALGRKGLVRDARAQVVAGLHDSGTRSLQTTLSALQALRKTESATLNSLARRPSARVEARLEAIRTEIETIERGLTEAGQLSPVIQPITVATLAAQLPPKSRLVEYLVYTPYDAVHDRHTEPHLAAVVISPDGHAALHGLGPWQEFEARLTAFRQNPGLTPLARWLHGRLLAPLELDLSALDHLIVAPDGALAQTPFEALADPDGTLVLDQALISYLSTGRDLLRRGSAVDGSRSGAVAIANPDYGAEGPLMPLPGTGAEAEVFRRYFPDAEIWTGTDATVDVVRTLSQPRYLHLGTHGFVLPDNPGTAADDNPMARTGLWFAGANDPAVEDTRLLATEAALLDLTGTELVVLGACRSGLGEAESGEGVYGLRRAVQLAGARSMVVSLWDVDDEASAAFMDVFYGQLQMGASRGAAMTTAKQTLREDGMTDPRLWAAYVLVGDWE